MWNVQTCRNLQYTVNQSVRTDFAHKLETFQTRRQFTTASVPTLSCYGCFAKTKIPEMWFLEATRSSKHTTGPIMTRSQLTVPLKVTQLGQTQEEPNVNLNLNLHLSLSGRPLKHLIHHRPGWLWPSLALPGGGWCDVHPGLRRLHRSAARKLLSA